MDSQQRPEVVELAQLVKRRRNGVDDRLQSMALGITDAQVRRAALPHQTRQGRHDLRLRNGQQHQIMDCLLDWLRHGPQLPCGFPVRRGQGLFQLPRQELQARTPCRTPLDVEALDSPAGEPEELVPVLILFLLCARVRGVIQLDGPLQPARCLDQGNLEGKVHPVGFGKVQRSRCRPHRRETPLRQPVKAEAPLRQHAQQLIEPLVLGGRAQGAMLLQQALSFPIVDEQLGNQAEPDIALQQGQTWLAREAKFTRLVAFAIVKQTRFLGSLKDVSLQG